MAIPASKLSASSGDHLRTTLRLPSKVLLFCACVLPEVDLPSLTKHKDSYHKKRADQDSSPKFINHSWKASQATATSQPRPPKNNHVNIYSVYRNSSKRRSALARRKYLKSEGSSASSACHNTAEQLAADGTSSHSGSSGMGFTNLQYVQELGRGAFGSVVLAIDADSKQLMAVKKLPRASVQSRYTESELINHRWVTSPLLHVVSASAMQSCPISSQLGGGDM